MRKFRVAEFFAGAGLVRRALEGTGRFSVVFANDIEPKKERLYRLNFPRSADFRLGDIRLVGGAAVPAIDLATASFPCTDLSLAGQRKGLKGKQSGAFHEFARIVDEMGANRPKVVLLENVVGFASSHGGRDLCDALLALNNLGYACDLLHLDARWFAAQSRPRLFVVAVQRSLKTPALADRSPLLRPKWLAKFIAKHDDRVEFTTLPLVPPDPDNGERLSSAVEKLRRNDPRWWDARGLRAFERSLAPRHRDRLHALAASNRTTWATTYRRTRGGSTTWEIRPDDIGGCLRTTGGGSSRQALVEAGRGEVRVRWMTAREYASLQGFPEFKFEAEHENEAMFALGDAVCVPVFDWLGRNCLSPLLAGKFSAKEIAGQSDAHVVLRGAYAGS